MDQQSSLLKRKGLLMALFVGVGVAAAAAAVVTVRVLESIDEQVEEMGQQRAIRSLNTSNKNNAPFAVEISISEELPEAEDLDLQMRSIEMRDVVADGPDSEGRLYQWVYLVGLFENQSQRMVRDLEVELRVLDSNGEELWTQHESQLTSGLVSYRPGDVIPMGVYLKAPTKELNHTSIGKVEVIPTTLDSVSFLGSNERGTKVDFTWEEPVEPTMDVVIRARPKPESEDANDLGLPAAVYAVENVGEVVFERLSLRLEWARSTDNIQAEVCPVVTGPALQPGDEFLVACGSAEKKEGLEPSLRLQDYR